MNDTLNVQKAALKAEINGTTLTITFAHGKSITVEAMELSEDIRMTALMHGLKQKLADAAAISRNTDTGKSASVEDKYRAVEAVAMRIRAGEWNAKREGSGAVTGGLLLEALVRHYAGRKTVETLREWLATKSDKEKAALRATAPIAAHIDAIRAERAKDKDGIDADELLSELED